MFLQQPGWSTCTLFTKSSRHNLQQHQSTRCSYAQKWSRFCHWLQGKHPYLRSARLSFALDFILSFRDSGLSHSSLRVYLATLSAYHKIDSCSLFSHPMTKYFMWGMLHVYPHIPRCAQPWDLLLVPRCLTRHPFEPAATCALKFLSWKMLFLVAITSARCVSELAALDSRPPFLVLLPHAVQLLTNMTFLPKLASEFRMNSKILLSDFFPSLVTPKEKLYHSLDVTRALKFYIHKTQFPDRHHSLFVSYFGLALGGKISSEHLSKWIVGLIGMCYYFSKFPLLVSVTSHSTRAMVTSTAFLEGIPLDDICEAATWKTSMMFIRHYALKPRAV